MSKSKLSYQILVFALLFVFSSAIYAQQPVQNQNQNQENVRNTSQMQNDPYSEGPDESIDISLDEMSIPSSNAMKRPSLQDKKLEFQAKRENLNQTLKNRQQKFEMLKSEQQLRFQSIQQMQLENQEERTARLEQRFSQIQITQLTSIQNRILLTSARYTKAVEHLYGILNRIENQLLELEKTGFSYETQKTELTKIQNQIEDIEADIESLKSGYTLIEGDSPQNVATVLQELKDTSNLIKLKLNKTKTTLVSLVNQAR